MGDFGFLVIQQRAKVTQDPKDFSKLIRIPCQIGFKQIGKTWLNEWFDILVFPSDPVAYEVAKGIHKGDRIQVSGRFTMSDYDGKRKYSILANQIEIEKRAEPDGEPYQRQDIKDEDVPF
jgi:hypothetical protein